MTRNDAAEEQQGEGEGRHNYNMRRRTGGGRREQQDDAFQEAAGEKVKVTLGGGGGGSHRSFEYQKQQQQQHQQPPLDPAESNNTRSKNNVSFTKSHHPNHNAAQSFLDVSRVGSVAGGGNRSIILDSASHFSTGTRNSSLILLEQVQEPGAISFIGQAVQDVLDVGLLAKELLRVAQLFAEFNQGRFGGGDGGGSPTTTATMPPPASSWAATVHYPPHLASDDSYDDTAADDDDDDDVDVEDPEETKALIQTMEWGILVAQRMIEVQSLIEQHNKRKVDRKQQQRSKQEQQEAAVYVAYAGADKVNGYLARLEEVASTTTTSSRRNMMRFARDTTKLLPDQIRDPPASLLYHTCVSAPVILVILSWEATQEAWPIAELFCALALQRRKATAAATGPRPQKQPQPPPRGCQLVVDAYPGQVWLDVNAQLQQFRSRRRRSSSSSFRSPSDRWRRDLQRLFPVDDLSDSAYWIPYTEATTDAHVQTVARTVAKILRTTTRGPWWCWW